MPAPLVYSYIRFSTPQQALGDSKRRQTALAEEWAASHNMALDSSLSLTDLGVSAFRSSNAKEGALGGFLRMVQDGKVPHGSVLVVESLDRISRDEVLAALSTFTSIINAGITVVTLGDKREYTKESVNKNPMDLMLSILVMSRAHEESATKSKRLIAAWENKRKHADTKKLSSLAPLWLKLNTERTDFEVIPERAELVKRVFQMCVDGYGANSISKLLNSDKVPTFKSKSRGWHLSAVKKILNNKAVIGEFQAHKMNKGKRVPIGEPLAGYFPEIVKEATFYQAQAARKLRKGKAGKSGIGIASLFGHVAKCGHCGDSMVYVDKGRKSSPSLVCSSARRGRGCAYMPYRYSHFESIFLRVVREVNLEALSVSDERAHLGDKIVVLEGRLRTLESKIEKTTEAIGEAPNVKALAAKLNQLETQRLSMDAEQETLLASLKSKDTSESGKELRDMVVSMMAMKGDELRNFRAKVRQKVREVVVGMRVFSGEDTFLDIKRKHKRQITEDEIEDAKKFRRVEVQLKDGMISWRHWHITSDNVTVLVKTKDGKVILEKSLTETRIKT